MTAGLKGKHAARRSIAALTAAAYLAVVPRRQTVKYCANRAKCCAEDAATAVAKRAP